ncbi:hypothetical protein A2276_03510 [candidate division WOR-1 bacterium RIFOXYA12_FULL_43_27]|uniref:PDGLE domain-containing protein n=1 Tax=candidate division WOR-1 bacterium RIFOXYC2_FULL_46_14 TaxID=1802587 RepID=A0A1F4U788_UNCSA|nr:MAG: hypothetical protein A2276_03510 [candidate division WOR-1 bacterium RIFOXYA12_FULL_43_27]OGC19234.1 MAG: hypothetical protein A2292_00825 [candidate division WOR-1 bacterium RIFOXYB2_FULL_46_45]OGC30223.1 MAG: hypothetical protein A2232_00825 [candidate division WOR-1 bacterium RIFOXYA2_FULL_46_56]OGC40824.1 MAG: hypothetical protein A2438_00825 [candidate division WOR-1 bacterium RIFOXYC2_FULL_46_14]
MKKLFFVAILVAVVAAFFASANPDGLDFVAEQLGFAGRAIERPGLPYTVGVLGVFLTAGIFWGVGRILKLILLLILILVCSSPVFAARPLVTDDYGTVELGKYELEAGFNAVGFLSQIKRGMAPNIDLGLEIPYNTSAVSGLADLVLHGKWRLKDFGEDEGVTVRVDAKLTNGDAARGLGSGFLDYGLIMILSKKLGGLASHFNLGYVVIGDAANSVTDDTFVYGAAVENYFQNGIGLGAEIVGICCQIRTTANLQLCARYQASDSIRFDAGYSMALTDNSSNIATGGLTCAF